MPAGACRQPAFWAPESPVGALGWGARRGPTELVEAVFDVFRPPGLKTSRANGPRINSVEAGKGKIPGVSGVCRESRGDVVSGGEGQVGSRLARSPWPGPNGFWSFSTEPVALIAGDDDVIEEGDRQEARACGKESLWIAQEATSDHSFIRMPLDLDWLFDTEGTGLVGWAAIACAALVGAWSGDGELFAEWAASVREGTTPAFSVGALGGSFTSVGIVGTECARPLTVVSCKVTDDPRRCWRY